MSSDSVTAQQALQNARQALQRGDRQAARRWAEQAANLAPNQEDPWLVLAVVSSPRASVACIERALQINPESRRAREGMAWALDRVRKEGDTEEGDTAPTRVETRPRPRSSPPPSAPFPRPAMQAGNPRPRTTSASRPVPYPAPARPRAAKSRKGPLWLLLILAILCTISVMAFWPGNAAPVLAFLREGAGPQYTPTFPGGPADIAKPTYTATMTATFTPTATLTPTPTFTPTATFTSTPTPTETLTPTETFTPWPTYTPLPYTPPTPVPPVEYPGEGERWIEVNLSEQRLYAWEGNVLMNSFIVSTGTWQYPTVTGNYHIYIKLTSTTMSGPGYYLPNVPYTMYFYEGYGIHGTYWHNNFGTPMSHGCVNMRTSDAAWLFDFASVGTLVNVHY